jgi:hypothetical protein
MHARPANHGPARGPFGEGPPGRHLLGLLVALVLGWLVFWSVDVYRSHTTPLGPHLQLVERVRVERSPFSLAGGDGGFAAIPLPSRYERVVGQRVVRDGVTVWRGEASGATFNRDMDVFASPDERLLALQHRIRQDPLVIHDLSRGVGVSVGEPDSVRAQEHYGYAMRFFGWSPDSRYLYMFNDRMDLGDVYTTWTRYVWRVDVRDGGTALDRTCTDRYEFDPDRKANWAGTACETGAPR